MLNTIARIRFPLGHGRRVATLIAITLLPLAHPTPASAQLVSAWEASTAVINTPRVAGMTVRQFAVVAMGASAFRIRLSNETGTRPLSISDVHAALPDTSQGSVSTASDRPVLFHGNNAITVGPGEFVLSDPVNMPVAALTRIAVSAYFYSNSLHQVGHLLASETNYIAPGDHSGEATMAGARTTDSGFYLSGIAAVVGHVPGGTVACLGDSITDGLFSTENGETRYPDILARRLLSATNGQVTAIDAGLVGNGLITGSPSLMGGDTAINRLARDVLTRAGVHWLIVFEGINDIIYPPDNGDTAAELIAAYTTIISKAHAAKVRVFGVTLTPWAGSGPKYWSPAKENVRQTVNAWIRTSGAYDGVFDFDAVVRNPNNSLVLKPAYDSDHLHFNDVGYTAVANSIDLSVLLARP